VGAKAIQEVGRDRGWIETRGVVVRRLSKIMGYYRNGCGSPSSGYDSLFVHSVGCSLKFISFRCNVTVIFLVSSQLFGPLLLGRVNFCTPSLACLPTLMNPVSTEPTGNDLKITPSDDDLKTALLDIKSQKSSLGITKTHALLLSEHPTWSVSEKRVRKVLQAEGLLPPPVLPVEGRTKGKIYPSSKLIDKLDVSKWTPKVQVTYFDKAKGKGLIAKERIAEGETGGFQSYHDLNHLTDL
jgi:hypothetical protein